MYVACLSFLTASFSVDRFFFLFFSHFKSLKGQFSRIDYMRSKSQRHFPAQVLSDLTIRLPPKIHTPYVYDVIGNVSTTHFRPSADPAIGRAAARPSASAGESVLELRPRYPLLGGWEYNFTLGWDQELGESLRKDPEGDGWTLAVGFLTALDGVQYEKVEWTVVLPEGATFVPKFSPFFSHHPTALSPNLLFSPLLNIGR